LISSLTNDEKKLLELFSNEINNSKRVEESIILENILVKNRISILDFKKIIKLKYEYECSDEVIISCINNLNFGFVRNEKSIVEVEDNEIIIGKELQNAIKNECFLTFFQDNIKYAITQYDSVYNKKLFVNGFIRYNKYTRKDVCRILNWPNDISSTVYGYRTNNKKTPCFVTYHKSNDISENTQYNDYFIDQYSEKYKHRIFLSQTIISTGSNILNNHCCFIIKLSPTILNLYIHSSMSSTTSFLFIKSFPSIKKTELIVSLFILFTFGLIFDIHLE
jgi:hypothetical protein